MSEKRHYPVFEVFVQKDSLSHHIHCGSVVAPTPDMALQTARESFLRRESAVNIWVVRQEDIAASPTGNSDFLANRTTDKTYREVSGYSDNARKWKRFKESSITIQDLIHDVQR